MRRFLLPFVMIVALSGCAQLSDADRALISEASQQAKRAADTAQQALDASRRAESTANRALTASEKAAADAKSARETAERIFRQSQRK